MAKGHKPVAGSRAYWPRKRAKRIYSSFRTNTASRDVQPLCFAGYKAGMSMARVLDNTKTSVNYGKEIFKPVTVLDCPSHVVCAIRAYRKTPYGMETIATVWSEKLSKDLGRKTRIPKKPVPKIQELEKNLERISDIRLLVHTKPREPGFKKKKPELFEVSLGGDLKQKFEYAKGKLGNEIHANEVFREGEFVDVKSVSKGKGFQGPVKRFGIRIRPRKHEKKRRHVGNLGPRNVARVLPGKLAMAGQLGFQTRTEHNKKILKLDSGRLSPKGGWLNYGLVSGEYIVLEGSVPGPKKRLIMLRKGVRPSKKKELEVKEIILESQQGV